MLEARTGTMRGRSMLEPSTTRRASPPVACASGFSMSVVEVTSENSFGLVGPTLISAFSVPSVACHRPSSLAGMVARHMPGSPALSVSSRVAPDGEVTVTGATLSAMVWRCTTRSLPLDLQPQRFFVQIGLLHQPVRHPPQQIEMRAAALIAARPQPDLVGQQQRDAAFAVARQQQQRLAVGAGHHRRRWWRCGYRRCGRTGSNAAARLPSRRARASPDGACRRR